MIFDLLFIAFIGLGFWWGYRKGIIYAVFSLAAYFIGIIAALRFSYLLIHFLQGSLQMGPKAIAVTAFILVFILVVLLIRFTAWALEQVLKSFSLNLPNQLAGGAVHALIGLYILCVLIWFLNKWDIFPESQKRDSHVYAYIADLGPRVMDYSGRLVPYLHSIFHDYEELMQRATPHPSSPQ